MVFGKPEAQTLDAVAGILSHNDGMETKVERTLHGPESFRRSGQPAFLLSKSFSFLAGAIGRE